MKVSDPCSLIPAFWKTPSRRLSRYSLMAAVNPNANANPSQREQFLLQLAPIIQANLPVPTLRLSDVATGPMANEVDNATAVAFGPPEDTRLPRPSQHRRVPRRDLNFDELAAEIDHPFNGPEKRTSVYVLEMLREAIRRANWIADDRRQPQPPQPPQQPQQPGPGPPANHLYIRQGFPIRYRPGGNQGPISGIADIVVMRNRQPICVVEVKRYELDNAHFTHGVAQAFVSAAALGQSENIPVRGITGDMRRWRFMNVKPNEHSLSREGRISYDRVTGVPSADDVQEMIRRLTVFLMD